MASAAELGRTGGRGKAAVFGVFASSSFRTLPGTISAPELEELLGAAALAGELRGDAEAMAQVREQLLPKGFTAAPGSAELVGMINDVPSEELAKAGVDFRNCVGLSQEQLLDPQRFCLSPSVARVVLASLAQLDSVLPAGALVLGPIEGTFRGQRGGIGWLHNDEHRTSEVYVEQALFPLARPELDEESTRDWSEYVFQHYNELKRRAEKLHPELSLPCPPELPPRGGGESGEGDDALPDQDEHGNCLRSFTKRVIAAIDEYNAERARLEEARLEFDVVNVWIPRAEKQLALLPFEFARGAVFQRDTRPSVEEVEAAGYQHNFQSFGKGTAVMFFGRYVLHQVAEGPDFAKCVLGSMETRYLVLMPREVPR